MLITLDFETYYGPDLSLRGSTTEAYIRDRLFEVIGFAIKVNDQPAQWHSGDHAYLSSVLRSVPWHECALAAHNCRFDASILNWIFGCTPKKYLDTQSMARGLVGLHTRTGLDALLQFFQAPITKGNEVVKAIGMRRADFSPQQLADYGRYCETDTEGCYWLLQKLLPCTLPTELQLQDWTIRCFVEPKLVLDEVVLRDELKAYHQRKDLLLTTAGITDVAELRSDDRMATALIALGVDPPTKYSPKQKNADGSPKQVWAFSRQDLPFMDLLEDEDEKVVALVEARLGTKSSIVQSRLERMINIAKRGPMPMPIVYAGAVGTRRWSGDDQINVQNMPRNKLKKGPDGKPLIGPDGEPVIDYSPLRRAICAPPGKMMAAPDLSQIELRVNAWQSGQRDVLELLRDGGDVYSDQATALYGYEVTKKSGKTIHTLERFVGKTTELQCGYQCGAEKFIHSLKVAAKRDGMVLPDTSIEFGQRIVSGYRSKRDYISGFWKIAQRNIENIAYGLDGRIGPYEVRDNKVWLPNGSYLYYPDLRFLAKEGEGEQGCEWSYSKIWKGRPIRTKLYGGKLVENITQAVARLFVSDALLRLEQVRYADGRRVFDIVFSVHDELVVLFDDTLDLDWVRQTLRWAMTTPPAWAPDIPLGCDIGIGRNYAECK